VARPKRFNEDAALACAGRVFTRHGFEGTSTEDLLAGMGLSRQSMYDTFGDKRGLYLAALRRYVGESTAAITDELERGAPSLERIEAALLTFLETPAARPKDGCLGVGATMEFGRDDPDVAEITDAAGATLRAAFERVVESGRAAGAIAAEVDPRIAAQFLLSTLMGLKVSARAGVSRSALRASAHLALRALR
jgi:AcrR family transcriptional regulator